MNLSILPQPVKNLPIYNAGLKSVHTAKFGAWNR